MNEAVVESTPNEASAPVVAPVAPETPGSSVVQDRRDAVVPEGDAPEIPPAPDGEAKTEPTPDPVPKGVQKRIDRAVREKYEAQARAKMLEERIAQIEARQQPSAPVAPIEGMPTIDKFNNFDEYVTAKAEFIAKRHIEQAMSEGQRRQAEERQHASQVKLNAEWTKRVEKFTAEMPDFEEVITASTVPMTDPMQQTIKELDLGPKLAYHLANHPDEAAAIADMTPLRAIAALGRLEERLSKPAEKKTTSAPAPITPVGGTARVSKDPGDMSMAEFTRWRRSVIKAR